MHLSFWWAKMISEINSERKGKKKKELITNYLDIVLSPIFHDPQKKPM
jgi:hypothetical protein